MDLQFWLVQNKICEKLSYEKQLNNCRSDLFQQTTHNLQIVVPPCRSVQLFALFPFPNSSRQKGANSKIVGLAIHGPVCLHGGYADSGRWRAEGGKACDGVEIADFEVIVNEALKGRT